MKNTMSNSGYKVEVDYGVGWHPEAFERSYGDALNRKREFLEYTEHPVRIIRSKKVFDHQR